MCKGLATQVPKNNNYITVHNKSNCIPVFIDETKKITPFRSTRKRLIYSYHYALLLTLENLPMSKVKQPKKEEKKIIWNLNKENGWTRFKELTDKTAFVALFQIKSVTE